MPAKDYYSILHIPSSATMDEVKKAFRKLALIYHPDKHPDTRLATAKFAEIREAYSILSNRKKRAEYNYTRYSQSIDPDGPPLAGSPEDILQLSFLLQEKVARMDPFRIDRDRLFYEVSRILSDPNMDLLKKGTNTDMIRKIVLNITGSIHPLSLTNVKEIIEKLHKIAGADPLVNRELSQFLYHIKLQHNWNRYKFLIALFVAVLLCVFIYLAGR